jgi:hypothetical protein
MSQPFCDAYDTAPLSISWFFTDYSVFRAAIISHELVLKNSVYVKHTNAWKFMLRDAAWTWPGVLDVTEELRAVKL